MIWLDGKDHPAQDKPTVYLKIISEDLKTVRKGTLNFPTAYGLLFTRALNSQVVEEAREMFIRESRVEIAVSRTFEFSTELKWDLDIRLIQDVTWKVKDDDDWDEYHRYYHRDHFDKTLSFCRNICSASAAMRFRIMTVDFSSNKSYGDTILDQLFDEIADRYEEAVAHMLSDRVTHLIMKGWHMRKVCCV